MRLVDAVWIAGRATALLRIAERRGAALLSYVDLAANVSAHTFENMHTNSMVTHQCNTNGKMLKMLMLQTKGEID